MNTIAIRLRNAAPAAASARDLALLAFVWAVTLVVELALVERKYAIIGGGFGQSHALAGPGPLLVFAVVLAACHGFLLTLLFLAMRRLHPGTARGRALFRINFLILVPAAAIAALIAKYQVLSYFSDAISFELIRKLGGGSLFNALLFVLSEGALMIGGGALGLAGYVMALCWYVRRFATPSAESMDDDDFGLRLPLSWLAIAAAAIAATLFLSSQRADLRGALWRFNAVWMMGGALELASDVDRDGWGLFARPFDSHPFDGTLYPYALDVPGNGVDEDGIGGDFHWNADSLAAEETSPVRLPAKRKHLVLVVLESTRSDALGRRLGGRWVTPHINTLAAAGSAFPAAYSHVGFTTYSLKSLFSGRLETAAGGPSLFRDLKANGYRIGVFSGQAETFGDMSQVVGMHETADVFIDAERMKQARTYGFAAKASIKLDGWVVLNEFDRAFGRREAWERPVFAYFNLQSAHFPYHHEGMEQRLPGRPIPRSRISRDNRDWVAATYWNAVADSDSEIGALIARLKRLGVYDDTVFVVTSDHGESLFDDGFLGHGHMLNRQQTHVLLVVNVPGVARSEPMGLADYRGMILRLLGAKVPERGTAPVLQYIGTLDRPAYVGLVEAGQRWTVLKLEDRSVRFSDVAGVHDQDRLAGPLKARADLLVATWERERWTKHLRSMGR